MLKLLSMVAAVIVWGLLSLTLPPEIFPGPIETTRALWGEIAGGRVGTDVAMTMLRVVAGLLLALMLGVPVGILMGLNRRAEARPRRVGHGRTDGPEPLLRYRGLHVVRTERGRPPSSPSRSRPLLRSRSTSGKA